MFEDKEGFIIPVQVDVARIDTCSLLDFFRSHIFMWRVYRETEHNDYSGGIANAFQQKVNKFVQMNMCNFCNAYWKC